MPNFHFTTSSRCISTHSSTPLSRIREMSASDVVFQSIKQTHAQYLPRSSTTNHVGCREQDTNNTPGVRRAHAFRRQSVSPVQSRRQRHTHFVALRKQKQDFAFPVQLVSYKTYHAQSSRNVENILTSASCNPLLTCQIRWNTFLRCFIPTSTTTKVIAIKNYFLCVNVANRVLFVEITVDTTHSTKVVDVPRLKEIEMKSGKWGEGTTGGDVEKSRGNTVAGSEGMLPRLLENFLQPRNDPTPGQMFNEKL